MAAQSDMPVWYAAYGSNLLTERFLAYIIGGPCRYSSRSYRGCADKHPPLKDMPYEFCRELYFSKSSKTWGNGGVAFITPEETVSAMTYGRCYLISLQQFIDITLQENGLDPARGVVSLDPVALSHAGSVLLMPESDDLWYNRVLYCGTLDDIPVLTITASHGENSRFVKPDAAYLRTIFYGLSQSWGLDNRTIIYYLIEKKGISGNYSADDLQDMAEKWKSSIL